MQILVAVDIGGGKAVESSKSRVESQEVAMSGRGKRRTHTLPGLQRRGERGAAERRGLKW
jgi:hypothetical protein